MNKIILVVIVLAIAYGCQEWFKNRKQADVQAPSSSPKRSTQSEEYLRERAERDKELMRQMGPAQMEFDEKNKARMKKFTEETERNQDMQNKQAELNRQAREKAEEGFKLLQKRQNEERERFERSKVPGSP